MSDLSIHYMTMAYWCKVASEYEAVYLTTEAQFAYFTIVWTDVGIVCATFVCACLNAYMYKIL